MHISNSKYNTSVSLLHLQAYALYKLLLLFCQVVDNSVGANRRAITQASDRLDVVPEGKQRFQAGNVDEVSFLG